MKTLEQLTQKQRDNYYQNLGVWKLINKKVKKKFGEKFIYNRIYTEIQSGGRLRTKYYQINTERVHDVVEWLLKKFPFSIPVKIQLDGRGTHITLKIGKPVKSETKPNKAPIYFTFNSIQGNRKPNNPDDVTFKVGVEEMSDEFKKQLKKLPIIELPYDYFSYGSFFDDFRQYPNIKKENQYFLIKWNRNTYFVDTQGYEYARYVTKIIGDL